MRGKAEKSTRFVLALREQPRTRGEKEMQEGLDRLVDGTTPRVRGILGAVSIAKFSLPEQPCIRGEK